MYGGLATATSAAPASSARTPLSARTASPSRRSTAPVCRPPAATSTLRRAHAWASGSSSTATTRAAGTSAATATAIAPDPVQRSTTSGCRSRSASSIARPATTSVSGRGTKTPGPTASSTVRNGAVPVRCCSGTRRARSATSSSNAAMGRPSTGAPRSTAPASSPRGSPKACAARSSASAAGVGTPAAESRLRASRSSSASSMSAVLAGQRPGGLGVRQARRLVGLHRGGDDRLEVAVEHLVEVVGLVAGAVVRDPVLRVVVGPDALAAVDGTDLRPPRLRGRALCHFDRDRMQAGPQDTQGLLLVLQLRLLVLAADDDAGRQVRDADGGVRRVDALPAGPGRPEDVDAQVVRVDLDLDVLHLGQHENAGRAGVDPALGLRHRDPLDAVHTALELHARVDALAGRRRAAGLDGDRDVLEAAEVALRAVQLFGPPALPLRVAQVHTQEVTGEQRGLLAALPRLDLEDDVAFVVRVARDEAAAQPVVGAFVRLLEDGQLGG